MCGDAGPGRGNSTCKGPVGEDSGKCQGWKEGQWDPKLGWEGGALVLGNDTGQVGRGQITQDLRGLREGSGVFLGEIRGRPICILGR